MKKVISIGIQGFSELREQDCFFIDKTNFIKEWWDRKDIVTLITRPRRFGKTLNMSMMECFFSNKYANRADLFEGLSIWEEEKYRKLQGTYPVIFLSFAAVKADNLPDVKEQIKQEIVRLIGEMGIWRSLIVSVRKRRGNIGRYLWKCQMQDWQPLLESCANI